MAKTVHIAITGAGTIDVAEIYPLQGDLVELTDENRKRLRNEILSTGFAFSPHVWRNPLDSTIYLLDGHQRVRVLKELREEGVVIPPIPVTFVEAESAAAAKRRILQARSQYGKMTEQGLASFAFGAGLKVDDIKVSFDFPQLDMDKFTEMFRVAGTEVDVQAHTRTTGLTDENEVPDVVDDPGVRRGDVFILGQHRLMCGDSVDKADIECLVAGNGMDLIVTDPPWNVNYGAVDKGNVQGYVPRTILNDFMNPEKWAAFLSGAASGFKRITKPGAPIYCVMGVQQWPAIHKALQEAGFHWSSSIIWTKDRLVLSRKDYHLQYEPIWYGWNEDGPRLAPLQDRSQTDVWECDRPHRSELHPTTKPVELLERAINNSSQVGDYVADLFGGSGSTLIACEKTGRRCFMMELDPKYVRVIVNRWEAYTGQKAQLLSAHHPDCLHVYPDGSTGFICVDGCSAGVPA